MVVLLHYYVTVRGDWVTPCQTNKWPWRRALFHSAEHSKWPNSHISSLQPRWCCEGGWTLVVMVSLVSRHGHVAFKNTQQECHKSVIEHHFSCERFRWSCCEDISFPSVTNVWMAHNAHMDFPPAVQRQVEQMVLSSVFSCFLWTRTASIPLWSEWEWR